MLRNNDLSEFGTELWFDLLGGFFIAISVNVFAANANFAPGGVNGAALIINYLFDLPIGIVALLLNIPIILFSYKYLGKVFLLRSLKTMVICTIMMDYVVPTIIPAYTGSQLLASIFTGAIGGIGYALIYMQNSSTGGSDFLIMSIRKLFPHHSIGAITQLIDGSIIIIGMFAFKNIDAVLYGIIATVASTVIIDKIMYGANSGKLLLIVTNKADELAFAINEIAQRGSTFIHATGSYTKADMNVLMCACSRNQVYLIKNELQRIDPNAIMIITESNEVYGEGFIALKKNG